ncbi:hypothetical protein MUP77_12545 [Candidatus Bathyarchaeota archaeon]|nr:hypothetical protein [Candidatus Bathyarchaeota archaeon]
MGGIAGQFTKFEKVEIQSAQCTLGSGNTYWTITLKLKNTGTATATLTSIFINDAEVDAYDLLAPPPLDQEAATTMTTVTPNTIASGAIATINVYIDLDYGALSSGTTVNIKIHSAGGMDYPRLVELV